MKASDGHIRRLSVLGNKERAVPDSSADTPEHMLFIPAFEDCQRMEEELVSVIYNCDEWVRSFLVTYVVGSKLIWNRTKQHSFLLPLKDFH